MKSYVFENGTSNLASNLNTLWVRSHAHEKTEPDLCRLKRNIAARYMYDILCEELVGIVVNLSE